MLINNVANSYALELNALGIALDYLIFACR